jgi:hypothetical protein
MTVLARASQQGTLLQARSGMLVATRIISPASKAGLAAALGALALALALMPTALYRIGAHQEQAARANSGRLPLPAQAAISDALGRDNRSYQAHTATGGFMLANERHRLTARFGVQGVEVRSHGERLGITLRSWGYGQALRPVAAARPRAKANRVSYRRGPLTEWYADGPLGLEQGFALRARPSEPGGRALTLELSLSGSLRPVLERGRHGLRFAGSALRYQGLAARDARGRELPARMKLQGRTVLLQVDDRGARYPLTIDPFLQQAKLTASDGATGDQLGFSVAVSGDTVVAGAPYDKVGANGNQGSAYVFVKPASGWTDMTETAKLTASDGAAGDGLGWSVAIDGDTVVAGAEFQQGSAYVFVKPANGWADMTQTAKLTTSDGVTGDGLGWSVAIDGDTVVAGAPALFVNQGHGAAYVFVRPASGWADMNQTAKLTASDGAAGDGLGFSVAIAGDTVVAGAPVPNFPPNQHQGSAYVFVKPASGWVDMTQTAKLTSSDGTEFDGLGSSVAIAGDTVVAGASGSPAGGAGAPGAPAGGKNAVAVGVIDQGAAYVFVRPASGWTDATQTAKLTASDGVAGDGLGDSVAITGDTVVGGALGANQHKGAVYVFVEPASGWTDMTETAKLTASDGVGGDFLGSSLAIAGDTILAGAPGDQVGANGSQGAAYVFGTKANQTITFGGLPNKTYGDPDFAVSAAASSGLPVSFSASGSCTVSAGTAQLTGAGSCTITASQSGDGNYNPATPVSQSFSIARAGQTIVFGPLANKTYGDPDFAVSASASSGLAVSFAASGNCTVSGSTVHLTGAGSCTVTSSQPGNANYNAAPPVSQSFSIATKAPLQSPTRCTVPRVIGKRLGAAKLTIRRSHCRTGKVGYAYSRIRRKGIVISQSRRPGRVLPANSKINLVVSRGRKR